MITELSKTDFFNIINTMTPDEIKYKYGRIKIADIKQEPLFIVKSRITGYISKVTKQDYINNKITLKFISREILSR